LTEIAVLSDMFTMKTSYLAGAFFSHLVSCRLWYLSHLFHYLLSAHMFHHSV